MARPATDLRLRVLAAARAAFEADGFDATSLRAIARGAGTTIGMIYYYFPCLLYTSPSPRDRTRSRMPSSA